MDFFVGRTKEKNSLYQFYDTAKEGRGKLVLVSGEAGVGKTALVEETLVHSGLKVFTARCNDEGTPSYGPITSILRHCIRESGADNINCGHLSKYLPHILPELGPAPENTDAETLKETIVSALLNISEKETTAFFIDDIQWADNATFDLLTFLAENLSSKNLAIICTYRNDDVTGHHRIKKFRNDLRRRRKLNEITIEPLSQESTNELISKLLNNEPSNEIVERVFNLTQGFPLFIEELMETLKAKGFLIKKEGKTYFKKDLDIPLPENLKDAVLNHLEGFSEDTKKKLEICAVAGIEFNPDMIVKISGNEKGVDELFGKNILKETNSETAVFRHALIREAVYSQLVWSKRKLIHRKIAEYLSGVNSHPDVIALHWLSANEYEKAKSELIKSAQLSCKVYAYSDASNALNKALELWTEDKNLQEKTKILFLYAQCSQLSGNLNDSIKALKEITEEYSEAAGTQNLAEAYRMLAAIYALQGHGELSAASRLRASEIFYKSGMLANSASELIIAAGRYTALLKLELAYEYAVQSANYAKEADRLDIETQALALSGNILAMQGNFEKGRKVVQDALSAAIKNNLSEAASIIYRRLASTFEYASDYIGAKNAYFSAYNYCINEGKEVSAQICLGCMSNTLFLTGDWKKSLEISDDVIKNKNTPEGSLLVGLLIKGTIFALRGEFKKAKKNLIRATELSKKLNIVVAELGSQWALGLLEELSPDISQAEEYYTSVLNMWEETKEKHDAIIALTWASYFFSRNKLNQELTRCTEALAYISSVTGNFEALAGLAFALGETALLNNNFVQAEEQYHQALIHIEKLQMPLLQMLIYFRLGIVYRLMDNSINAKKYLLAANSISKNLGTRPFSAGIEIQLADLGVKSEESRKEDSDERISTAGLTRRQSEILELIAEGLTNKEIADKLFLSTRTVDMHVSHILERLNCRTRIEAINKARELRIV